MSPTLFKLGFVEKTKTKARQAASMQFQTKSVSIHTVKCSADVAAVKSDRAALLKQEKPRADIDHQRVTVTLSSRISVLVLSESVSS